MRAQSAGAILLRPAASTAIASTALFTPPAYRRLKSRPLPLTTDARIGPGYVQALYHHYSQPTTRAALEQKDKSIRLHFIAKLAADEIGMSPERRAQLHIVCNTAKTQAIARLGQGSQVPIAPAAASEQWARKCLKALVKIPCDANPLPVRQDLENARRGMQGHNLGEIYQTARNLADILSDAIARSKNFTNERELQTWFNETSTRVRSELDRAYSSWRMTKWLRTIFENHWQSAFHPLTDQIGKSVGECYSEVRQALLRGCIRDFDKTATVSELSEALWRWNRQAASILYHYPTRSLVHELMALHDTRKREIEADLAKHAAQRAKEGFDGWRQRCEDALRSSWDIPWLDHYTRVMRAELDKLVHTFPSQTYLKADGERILQDLRKALSTRLRLAPVQPPATTPSSRNATIPRHHSVDGRGTGPWPLLLPPQPQSGQPASTSSSRSVSAERQRGSEDVWQYLQPADEDESDEEDREHVNSQGDDGQRGRHPYRRIQHSIDEDLTEPIETLSRRDRRRLGRRR